MKKLLALFLALLFVLLLSTACQSQPEIIVTTKPTSQPTPTAVPTPSPTPEPTPSPTPDPYFTEQEEVTADLDAGYWLYRSPSLFVEINRVNDEENTLTYFVAEVRCKPGETERGGLSVPGKPNAKNVDLYQIVQNYNAVVGINGDFLKDHPEDPKGVVIRDGIVCVDNDLEDTCAFMPDGTIHIFEPGEVTADELLAENVKNAFSFGPTLIKDGVIQEGLDKHRLRSKNPRSAFGMIEPYHYLLVMVEGRSSRSKGMTLTELADLFASYQCEAAYNLDGGQSATMAFMGEHISEYKGALTGQRPVPDALMFGQTDLLSK